MQWQSEDYLNLTSQNRLVKPKLYKLYLSHIFSKCEIEYYLEIAIKATIKESAIKVGWG